MHLKQVVDEKNDIVAQLCGHQQLIKDQQQELKSLLRCKAENNDLQAQISSLNKAVQVVTVNEVHLWLHSLLKEHLLLLTVPLLYCETASIAQFYINMVEFVILLKH